MPIGSLVVRHARYYPEYSPIVSESRATLLVDTKKVYFIEKASEGIAPSPLQYRASHAFCEDRSREGLVRHLAISLLFLTATFYGDLAFSQQLPSDATAEPDIKFFGEEADVPPETTQHNGDMDHGGSGDTIAGSHHGAHRADRRAPAFLMFDHVAPQGEWMASYRYSNAYMNGNRAGTTALSDQQTLDFLGPVPPSAPGVDTFKHVPLRMTMEMHMVCIMRGIADDLTAYVMPVWMINTGDHLSRDGTTFRACNSGFGDIQFGALWRVYHTEADEVILNIGFGSPTGDIDNQMVMPSGMSMEYGYPMRLGRGTWGGRPAVTYRHYWGRSSLGFQGLIDLPMGLNSSDYRAGNEYRANIWFAQLLDADKQLALTFRVEGLWRSDYVGADPDLNPYAMPGACADMRGGEYLNFGYGVSYLLSHRLGRVDFEAVEPIVQNLRGVQLATDWAFAVRYSKSF